MLETDLEQLHDKLSASERKNVGAITAVMMARPCNERPMRVFPLIGFMVWQRNRIPPREGQRGYTMCTLCAMPTIHSRDRYGANGFTCGSCDRLSRTAIHGKWCFGCSACEPCEMVDLPKLTGETQAAARMARSERRPQGSSRQAPSLKAQQARERTAHLVKRQALAEESSIADVIAEEEGLERDDSDIISAPLKVNITLAEQERMARRAPRQVTARKQTIADLEKLGLSAVAAHPCHVKTRINQFQTRVVYDDRKNVGTFVTRRVYMCVPSENMLRGRQMLSATRILDQTNAEPAFVYVNGRRVTLSGDSSSGQQCKKPKKRK